MQEYIEREDEFDINPRPDEKLSGACATGRDDEEIDVETAEPIDALYCSSDEDAATATPRLHHLPLEIEPQRPSTPECASQSFPVLQRSLHLCHPPAMQIHRLRTPFALSQRSSSRDAATAVPPTAAPAASQHPPLAAMHPRACLAAVPCFPQSLS